MNREEIIKLAREAGFVVDEKAQQHQPNCIFHTHYMVDELLERFAALVAAAARAEENEACAKVCDDFEAIAHSDDVLYGSQENSLYYGMAVGAEKCAAAIRARKENT